MDSSEILNTSLDDLIFKDRNKAYGAYYLRKIYSKNANTATIITLLAFLLIVISPYIYSKIHIEPVVVKPKATVASLAPPPPLDKSTPPPPPPPNMPKPPKIPKFVPPVIVNTPPPPEETPPTVQQVQEAPPAVETDPNANYTIPTGNDQGSKVVDDDKNKVFTFVEQMPEFPGGEQALMDYLGKHIKYPPAARETNVEGTVFVSFVVDKNGNIGDIKVLRDIGAGCGDEAIRVIKSMPPWKPGKQNGNSVNVQYNLPVKFQLSSN